MSLFQYFHNRISAWIDRAIASNYAAGVSAIGLVLIPLMLVLALLPAISEIAARHIPVAMEKKLGRYILDANAITLPPSKLDSQTMTHYQDQVEKLALLAGLDKVDVEFRGGMPNALALPGNLIVLTDGLIDLMNDDDLIDAVIAHELGHLYQRHLMKKVVSINLFAEFALRLNGQDAMAGKVGSVLAGIGLAPHYSRSHEREADSYAIELLTKNDQSPLYFAKAMRKLEAFYKTRGVLASGYTSSHPDSEGRAQLAEQAAKLKN
jgi:Zn-dependent protease with chaperone function